MSTSKHRKKAPEWSAQSDAAGTCDGADSYLVKDGRVVSQSIHCTVRPRQ